MSKPTNSMITSRHHCYRQNYHDLHIKKFIDADVAAYNKLLFKMLKPGGHLIVVDHVAAAGLFRAVRRAVSEGVQPAAGDDCGRIARTSCCVASGGRGKCAIAGAA